MHHIAQVTLHGMSRVPVGGCPCGRMLAVAPFKIREQGLAPTRNLTLREQGLAPTRNLTLREQGLASAKTLKDSYAL